MNYDNETIIQRIQPQCDTLHLKMKNEKDAQHKTNQSVADSTGVPKSTVAKFFSGTLSNPGVFGVSAICIELGMSLDNLMGITPEQSAENPSRVMELELKLESSEAQVALLKEHSKVLEDGIKERKPLIYGLMGLCGTLFLVFIAYLMMDVSNMNFGFIRDEDHISPVLIVLVLLILSIAAWTAHRWFIKKKIKRNDKIDSN